VDNCLFLRASIFTPNLIGKRKEILWKRKNIEATSEKKEIYLDVLSSWKG